MKKNKGFTLIELLVVIAIIGVLASVVLASLNTARNKGADAAVKSQLANMRAEAEVYYDGTGASTYGLPVAAASGATGCGLASTMFKVDASFASAVTNLTANGAIPVCAAGGANLGTTATSWAMSAPLKAGGSWCVDNTGASIGKTATGGNASAAATGVVAICA